ncbi:MAG: prephenate dehydratase [Deltaproteobacteria bacterium]|nr:prephenate dehydratase [Deltaproteobacteria bacterium]MCL5276485.1 prephenate dehydratase [Deltaproteobacteria bacterium]
MINDHVAGLRKRIDIIDAKLIDLLNERLAIAIDINREKEKTAAAVYSPSREASIVNRLMRINKGPLQNDFIKYIFKEIFSASRASVTPPRIAFLGPEGTWAHQAALLEFGNSSPLLPAKNISEIFNEVEYSNCDFGVVPIENSMEGTVPQTLDRFIDSPLLIAREIFVPISYVLAARENCNVKNITKVYSHPQAIAQCRRWIRERLPNAITVDTDSTSQAAKIVQHPGPSVAIVSELAARLYGLKVLARRLEENPNNVTRFVVIGKLMPDRTESDKTSIIFAVKHRAGALYAALKPFSDYRVNLTKIESRPLKKKAWEYLFFVDIDGHIGDEKIKKAVSAARQHTVFFKFLGSYPKTTQEQP